LARAKKTDRAAARRRHRALVGETGTGASGQTGAASPSEPGTGAPPPGLFGGILSSIRRPNVLEDLRATPSVLLARPWILAPFGLVIVGAVLAAVGNLASGSIEATAVALLLAQPTLLYFVVGYLAPRGSYIFGAALGLFAAVLYVVIVLNKLGPEATGGGDLTSGALSYALIQVMSGALFAGFASWYRSFLRTAGERNRQRSEERRRAEQREQRRAASKPAASPKPQPQPAAPASPGPATQSTVQSLLNRFRPGR